MVSVLKLILTALIAVLSVGSVILMFQADPDNYVLVAKLLFVIIIGLIAWALVDYLDRGER